MARGLSMLNVDLEQVFAAGIIFRLMQQIVHAQSQLYKNVNELAKYSQT